MTRRPCGSCSSEILLPRKDPPVTFTLPQLETAANPVKATAALAEAVAAADLTPSEVGELSKLVDGFTRAVEQHDVQRRFNTLEAALERHKQGAAS